ncbi:hypothetical protein [Pedobacter sp.]
MDNKRFGKAFLCLLAWFFCANLAAKAQIIAWTFYNTATGTGTLGSEEQLSATSANANIEAPILTRGLNAVTGAGSARGFTGRFPITPTYYDAILNGSYYEFKVAPKNGRYVSLTTLNATLRPTSGSANTYRWVFSLDGISFIELGPGAVTITGTDTNGYPQATIDLSSQIYLQNIPSGTTITFRIYAWGGTVASGSFGFGKSNTSGSNAITIGGAVTDYPMVAGWTFGSLSSGIIATPLNASYNNPGIQITSIERGAGLTGASLSRGYASTAVNVNATKATAIANNAYYDIKITPKLGFEANLTALEFRFRSLSTGPRNYRWMYSKDSGTTFNELGNTDGAFLLTDGEGELSPLIDFSTNADFKNLHNNNTIIFRLYLWSNTSTGTVFGFGRDVSLSTEPTFKVHGTVIGEILPVNLSYFNANRQGGTVKLSWKTASEKNNSHFDIIRFEEGKPKAVIGKILAKGDGSAAQQYGFSDFNPPLAAAYYQLNQIDLDGKFQLYTPVHVKGISAANQLKVGISKERFVKLFVHSDAEKKAHLSIGDVTGNKMITKQVSLSKGTNIIQLDIKLNAGLYIANLQSLNGEKLSVKFIY